MNEVLIICPGKSAQITAECQKYWRDWALRGGNVIVTINSAILMHPNPDMAYLADQETIQRYQCELDPVKTQVHTMRGNARFLGDREKDFDVIIWEDVAARSMPEYRKFAQKWCADNGKKQTGTPPNWSLEMAIIYFTDQKYSVIKVLGADLCGVEDATGFAGGYRDEGRWVRERLDVRIAADYARSKGVPVHFIQPYPGAPNAI